MFLIYTSDVKSGTLCGPLWNYFTSGVNGKGRGLGKEKRSHDQMAFRLLQSCIRHRQIFNFKTPVILQDVDSVHDDSVCGTCVYIQQCQYLHFVLRKVPEQIGLLLFLRVHNEDFVTQKCTF